MALNHQRDAECAEECLQREVHERERKREREQRETERAGIESAVRVSRETRKRAAHLSSLRARLLKTRAYDNSCYMSNSHNSITYLLYYMGEVTIGLWGLKPPQFF